MRTGPTWALVEDPEDRVEKRARTFEAMTMAFPNGAARS
jgi:hypothetical protein